MTPSEACNRAGEYAGPADEGWNNRFNYSIVRDGFTLRPMTRGEQLARDVIVAPAPVESGWRYDYPSVIEPA